MNPNQINEEVAKLSDSGAERAILACLMTNPAKISTCFNDLHPDDFFNENNKYLYIIMLSLFQKRGLSNLSFDISMLLSIAKERGVDKEFIEKSGGVQYLEYLKLTKDSFVNCDSFDGYVDRVIMFSNKRKLFLSIEQTKGDLFVAESSAEEVILGGQARMNSLLLSSIRKDEYINLGSLAGDFIDESLKQKKALLGIPTGFKELDSIIEGLRRKNLLILMAPRKTGKSSFLMNVGLNVGVRQEIPTLMISTEMSDEEILSRALSNLSQVPQIRIEKGASSENEIKSLRLSQTRLDKGKFFHLFMPQYSPEKVAAIIHRFVDSYVGRNAEGKTNDCLVIFDYIKLPQSSVSAAQQAKEHKILGLIADQLKIIAGKLDIPILTACQTNRAGDVANSYELTWFCNTFMDLSKKTDKEMERDKERGNFFGDQRLRVIANRGGEECFGGINFQHLGETLTYQELGRSVKSND